MKVVVLGSSSFMGSCLIDYLLTNGYDVVGVSRTVKPDIFRPYLKNINLKNFKNYVYDINKDSEEVCKLLDTEKPKVIINCIALGIVDESWDKPYDYFTTNCVSLVKIVHHLVGCDYLDRFLQASSPELYGSITNNFTESRVYNPTSPYACSKAAFDTYLSAVNKQYSFPSILFRAANIYGPYQQLFRIIPKTIIKIKRQELLGLDGGGDTRRYFIHCYDLADGVLKLIKKGRIGEVYHFSGGEYLSIKELVKKICLLMDYDFNKLVINSLDRRGKDKDYNLNSDKAKRELNWLPKANLESGIFDTRKWVDNNWKVINEYSFS